ncbi:MAG: molybdopterin-binding protein [candidate division KSB1 bacterium]|nr:molybdopterin-binding protein [candidate division KSB1 bacterium]MDZ7300850.1 molybdopterin-binding protein [candidate division KSB1 bacterium]MDZ7309879.1 molybdopterin-binding protein [candidate division KSB1 bacterium]
MNEPTNRIATVTSSDRIAAQTRDDEGGMVIGNKVSSLSLSSIDQSVSPEDATRLVDTFERLADHEHPVLVFTTGGTGIAMRSLI